MTLVAENTELRQRADYTHKHNANLGRHGWLRLTPAYSVKVVNEILRGSLIEQDIVLDPFCGSGTTALCAAELGYQSTTIEINPFLIWLTTVKTGNYPAKIIQATRDACVNALALVSKKHRFPIMQEPPIHNIARWWSYPTCKFLCRLRPAIEKVTEKDSPERSLLLVAFCRTLIFLSNAAFNHQSMSFKENAIDLQCDLTEQFQEDLKYVLTGAMHSLNGKPNIIQRDARNLKDMKERFSLVITSPPYANRMSYIRELRPYMYWLGYLVNSRDAGELDWKAIGGTWGVATSRLVDWQPTKVSFTPTWLPKILDAIEHNDNANGHLMAKYIAKYAQDMWQHFESLTHILSPGARVHYIVGNSTFYGTMMPTEKLYAEFLAELGFSKIKICAIRKRNSKKELIEFDVSGQWNI